MYILIFVQSLFSIEQIGLGVWIWILSAILMNPSFREENHNQVKDLKNKVVSDYGRNFGREFSFLFGAIALLIVVPRVQEDSNFGKLLISKIDGNTNPSTIDAKVEKFTGFTLEEPKRVIGVANAYFLANWNQKAVEFLERVRLQDSNNWESRDALALAYGSLKQEAKAIEVRKEMEALDPNNWVNVFELANLHLTLGNEDNARLYFEKVKAMSPNSPEGLKSIENLLD